MATEDPSLTPQEQAKLKAFAQGLPDEPGEIDVDAIAQETGTSRRQVLQIIAAVGVGSIAGGVSVSQLVSEAQAQASTSDSDGNVGTPADRVDVFADGVDASVIDTEVGRITSDSTEVINVPSGVATLSEAMNNATEFIDAKNNVGVVVNIESGHEVTSTSLVTSGHYRNISVQSEDNTVPVGNISGNLFTISECAGPEVDVLFDLQGNGRDGADCANTQLSITNGSGFLNAGRRGISVRRASTVHAGGADFSGAITRCVHVSTGSMLSGQGLTANNAGDHAVYASRGCTIHVQNAEINNAGTSSVACRRSFINAEDVVIDGGGGITASNGSGGTAGIVVAADATLTGGASVSARNGSRIMAPRISVTNANGDAIRCESGAEVAIPDSTIDGTPSGSYGIKLFNGGESVNATNSTIKNTGSHGAQVGNGNTLSLANVTFENINGDAIRIYRGATARASGAKVDGADITTGDTNVSGFRQIFDDGGVVYGIIWA